jgi:hypothetical protein
MNGDGGGEDKSAGFLPAKLFCGAAGSAVDAAAAGSVFRAIGKGGNGSVLAGGSSPVRPGVAGDGDDRGGDDRGCDDRGGGVSGGGSGGTVVDPTPIGTLGVL